DLVFTDLEAIHYACGTNPFPSASVGAPHIRDRAYFVAHASRSRSSKQLGRRIESARFAEDGLSRVVAHTERRPAERQRLEVGGAASRVRGSSRQQRVRDDAGHGG